MYTKRSEKKKMSMSPLLGVKKEVLYPSNKYKSKVCVCVCVCVCLCLFSQTFKTSKAW